MLCEEPENKPSVYRKLGFPGGVFLVAQMVKNPPAMWETWVQSLCWEDPLEKGMATHPLQYSGLETSKGGLQRVRHN